MKMSASVRALPALGIVALSLIFGSCGNSNTSSNKSGQALVRFVNAIPDGAAIDVYLGGSKTFTNLAFGAAQPVNDPATYIIVPAGTILVQGFPTGTTTNPVPPLGNVPLNNATAYTMVAVGLEFNNSAPILVADNNTPPIGTSVEIRVINGSNSSPTGGVDVYLVPPGTNDLTNYTPQISGLNNHQASTYQNLSFLSGGYAVMVTAAGGKTPLINWPVTAKATSITTLVLVDNAGGNNGMSTTPLVFNDLN